VVCSWQAQGVGGAHAAVCWHGCEGGHAGPRCNNKPRVCRQPRERWGAAHRCNQSEQHPHPPHHTFTAKRTSASRPALSHPPSSFPAHTARQSTWEGRRAKPCRRFAGGSGLPDPPLAFPLVQQGLVWRVSLYVECAAVRKAVCTRHVVCCYLRLNRHTLPPSPPATTPTQQPFRTTPPPTPGAASRAQLRACLKPSVASSCLPFVGLSFVGLLSSPVCRSSLQNAIHRVRAPSCPSNTTVSTTHRRAFPHALILCLR
jgi:hypothetical protein